MSAQTLRPAHRAHVASAARTLAVAVAGALLLAGCTGSGGSGDADASSRSSGEPSASTSPAAAMKPPEVGSCHTPTLDQLHEQSVLPSTAVDCSGSHTSETVYTGVLPGSLEKEAYYSDKVQAYLNRQCDLASFRYLGSHFDRYREVVFGSFYFIAPKPAYAAGERWFRCDVAAADWANRKARPMPRTVRNVLDKAVTDDYRACIVQTRKKKRYYFDQTPCTASHSMRPVSTPLIGNRLARYPRPKAMTALLKSVCDADAGRWNRKHVSATAGYRFNWDAPNKQYWERGGTYGLCYLYTGK